MKFLSARGMAKVSINAALKCITPPVGPLLENRVLKTNFSALILAPHPDDEIIGCFHLIESDSRNNRFSVAIITQDERVPGLWQRRFGESQEVLSGMHVESVGNWGFRDGGLDAQRAELKEKLTAETANYDYVVCTAPNDRTPDHATLASVALEAVPHDRLIWYRSTWFVFRLIDADFYRVGSAAAKTAAIGKFVSQDGIDLARTLEFAKWEGQCLHLAPGLSVEGFQFASTDRLAERPLNSISIGALFDAVGWL